MGLGPKRERHCNQTSDKPRPDVARSAGLAPRHVCDLPGKEGARQETRAGGAIQRINPSSELAARLGQARRDELPSVYAEAGLWYDALAAMSELIDGAPNDAALRQQRAALLTQIGLPLVAER